MTTRRTFLGALAVLPVAASLPALVSDSWEPWARILHPDQGTWLRLGGELALVSSLAPGYLRILINPSRTIVPENGRHVIEDLFGLSFRYPRSLEKGRFHVLNLHVPEVGEIRATSVYITPTDGSPIPGLERMFELCEPV